MRLSFLSQAAQGQWALSSGEPIEEVVHSKQTSPRTRYFLKEALHVKAYGAQRGLRMHTNYQEFVQVPGKYVVWFVNASAPLSFTPKTFWFPVVGSFPGLSWFAQEEARQFAGELKEEGWDVNLRGVRAFSTGGWFADPLVSSMFSEHPAALSFFVDTLIHESTHATLLIPNQQYFNESLASFVGKTMATEFLTERYGPTSAVLGEYLQAIADHQRRVQAYVRTFQRLNVVYESPIPDCSKLAIKRTLLKNLEMEFELEDTPNNATLIGFQLYQEGKDEFLSLYQSCDRNWLRFFEALSSLKSADFDESQSSNIGAVIQGLVQNQCRPLERDIPLRSPAGRRLQRIGRR